MVVEVFITQGDRRDPLCDHGALVVDDEDGVSGVGDGGVEGVEQTDRVGDLAEQQSPGIGGEPASLKVGDNSLGPQGGKVEWYCVTGPAAAVAQNIEEMVCC